MQYSKTLLANKSIRPKPRWLHSKTAQAIGNHIYVPSDIYDNLLSVTPAQENVALLLHEETHLKRRKHQRLQWYVRYIFNPKVRFEEEIIATEVQLRYLKQNNMNVDFERFARVLSSKLYLWPVTYEYAYKRVTEVWNRI